MYKQLLTILFISLSLQMAAQSFGTQWIGATTSTDDNQLWFRRAYVLPTSIHRAHLEITTTGRVAVYVNQYNVSRDVLMPYREKHETHCPACLSFDVTPYIQADTNTIAVWYAPQESHEKEGEPQIAVWFYGTDTQGKAFAFASDKSWTWSIANANSVCIDATDWRPDWNSATPDIMPWVGATSAQSPQQPLAKNPHLAQRITKEMQPSWTHVTPDSIEAGFPAPLHGWIRVTLRGAHSGERITINKLHYICNGNMDEQACRRFTEENTDHVIIKGDSRFNAAQVQNIEGLQISTVRDE